MNVCSILGERVDTKAEKLVDLEESDEMYLIKTTEREDILYILVDPVFHGMSKTEREAEVPGQSML